MNWKGHNGGTMDDTHDKSLVTWRRREHERERRQLWTSVVSAMCSDTEVYEQYVAIEWADRMVEAFDERFGPKEGE